MNRWTPPSSSPWAPSLLMTRRSVGTAKEPTLSNSNSFAKLISHFTSPICAGTMRLTLLVAILSIQVPARMLDDAARPADLTDVISSYWWSDSRWSDWHRRRCSARRYPYPACRRDMQWRVPSLPASVWIALRQSTGAMVKAVWASNNCGFALARSRYAKWLCSNDLLRRPPTG